MQSFIKGENMKVNGSVLIASIIATAVWYQLNLANLVEGEEVPAWKTQGLYAMAALSVILTIPIVWGMVSPSSDSSFNTRIAEASSNLRESLEESSAPASEDFEARVTEAAAKLREQIGKSSATVVDYPVHEPSASSLAAQASAEIDRFIADNS